MTKFEQYLIMSRKLNALLANKHHQDANEVATAMASVWSELAPWQQEAYQEACTFHTWVLSKTPGNDFY